MSDEEKLAKRKENFSKLKHASFFRINPAPDVYRYFFALKQKNDLVWEVAELTENNRKNFLYTRKPQVTDLHFDAMCLLKIYIS